MCSNKTVHGNVPSSMIHNSQRVETPKCLSVDEWTKREPSTQRTSVQQQKEQLLIREQPGRISRAV